MSRLAVWSLRLALFSLVATFVAIIIVRSGALEIVPAVSTLGGALLLAVVAILLALAAGIGIWIEGYRRLAPGRRRRADRARAHRLSGLSRRARLSVAGDLRRHHRSDRSAAIRRHRPAAAARRQSDRLRGPLCRRAAARGLFGCRAGRNHRDAAGGVQRRHEGHHQTPLARGRRAPAAGSGRDPRIQMRARPMRRRCATASSRRWRVRRSSAFPRTWWCACARPATARASTCARRRATGAAISAATRSACAI